MEIKNKRALERELREMMGRNLHLACQSLVFELITQELPSGLASPLATEIHVIRERPDEVDIAISDPVWDYLSQGTGIYSSDGEHRGQGEGGAIVPTDPNVKALHFKDREIAAALGFKGDDVFLKSVKGVRPRWYWDRYFNPRRVREKMIQVGKEMKGKDIYTR